MRRLNDEAGFSLIELLVGMTMMLIVFGAVLLVLQVFQKDAASDQSRNEAQASARTTIDRLSRDLRNVASPVGGVTNSLQRATPYDLIFQTVSAGPVISSGDPTNQVWVRYCVPTGVSAAANLYRELDPPPSSTAALPAMPTTTACPGTTTSWPTQRVVVPYVSNTSDSPNHALFICGSPTLTGNLCPTGNTATSNIKTVEADIFVAPPSAPKEVEITGGVDLRNSLLAPVGGFNVTEVGGHVWLDGSASYDPNGQALSYQWYADGATLSGGTSVQFDAGIVCPSTSWSSNCTYVAGTTHTFQLVVSDTAGLTNCTTAGTLSTCTPAAQSVVLK